MMTHLPYRVFVQARMSSNRLPGKMLAPFRGQPMVKRGARSPHRMYPRPTYRLAHQRSGK
jgi:CMP-2-keto-3-deoxyoctulosonic acid synthetase